MWCNGNILECEDKYTIFHNKSILMTRYYLSSGYNFANWPKITFTCEPVSMPTENLNGNFHLPNMNQFSITFQIIFNRSNNKADYETFFNTKLPSTTVITGMSDSIFGSMWYSYTEGNFKFKINASSLLC